MSCFVHNTNLKISTRKNLIFICLNVKLLLLFLKIKYLTRDQLKNNYLSLNTYLNKKIRSTISRRRCDPVTSTDWQIITANHSSWFQLKPVLKQLGVNHFSESIIWASMFPMNDKFRSDVKRIDYIKTIDQELPVVTGRQDRVWCLKQLKHK